MNMVKRTISRVVDAHTQLEKKIGIWKVSSILLAARLSMKTVFPYRYRRKTSQEIKEYLNERAQEVFNTKAAQLNGPEQLLEFEKS